MRTVRAASCTPCDDDSECADPGAPRDSCEVLGKVWVGKRDKDSREQSAAPCDNNGINGLPRCRSKRDCSGGKVCAVARTKCKTCMTAAWKLKADGSVNPKGLYDLTSSPEEEDKEVTGEPRAGRLNSVDSGETKIENVRGDLLDRLSQWDTCITEDQPNDCEG